MKILLVVPNFKWADWDINTLWDYFPYNLCILASMIRDIVDVEIIDANIDDLSIEKFKEEIKRINPDIVGITVLMNQYGKSGHLAAKISKEVNSNIITILGGVYATVNSDTIIKDPSIDYVVIGEGEYILRDLILYFMKKGNLPKNGICYRENGTIINTGHSDFIKNLDDLPFPSYDLIEYERYSNSKTKRKSVDGPLDYPFASILTSRGCPIGCTFCQVKSIMGKQFRPRSAKKVLEEIEYIIKNYKIKCVIFDDDNILTNRSRAIELFKGMKKFNITWISLALAAFRLDKELFTLMKESGCIYVDIAIESASKRILKNIIKKPVDLDQIKQVISWANELDIFIAGNFMIGFPTETWDEIRTTIKCAEDIGLDYTKIFAVIPLKGTELWDIYEKYGYFKKNFNDEKIRWSTGQIHSNQYTSNDLTILRAYEWDRINFSIKEKREKICKRMQITEEELFDIRRNTLNNVSKLIENYE